MKLNARIKLKFKKANNQLVLKYNTYAKASFDQFLAASIVHNSKTKTSAKKFIDEMTGKGSLNQHFIKLYDEISSLDNLAVKNIIDNSMYLIQNISKVNYEYYPDLNVSFIGKKVIKGNLATNQELHKTLIPEGEFKESNIKEDEPLYVSNIYEVKLLDKEIKVILNGEELDVKYEMFENCVIKEVKSLEDYEGVIHRDINSDNWNIMTNVLANTILKPENYYIDNGDMYIISNAGVKEIKVGKVFGIYLYKQKFYEYGPKSKGICKKVAQKLMENKKINEFKTKALVKILSQVDGDDLQAYLNYILTRKDSKDLALLGFDLARKGYEKNWEKGVVDNFRQIASTDQELSLLYNIDSDLNYTNDELFQISSIDKTILKKEHQNQLEIYKEERTQIINSINMIIGEITNSGRREETKKLKNDADVKKYRKYCNKYIGHTEDNINQFSLEKLNNKLKDVHVFKELDEMMKKKLSSLI